MDIIIPVLILGCLGVIFGAGLAVASKKFAVQIDPRIEKIHGLLPGANCGACGGAGCFGFAESLVEGKVPVDACRVSSDDNRHAIAKILGQKLEKTARKIALVHCNGGTKAKDKYIYEGIEDCVSANSLMGGPKTCKFGCIGLGTCVRVCPFGAITMSDEKLPVIDPHKCKACNKCVSACPKKLFSLVPADHTVFVACVSQDTGKETKNGCPVGCIGCRLCEKACKFNAIRVENNRALIDYHKCTSCRECVKVCPSKTIRVREAL